MKEHLFTLSTLYIILESYYFVILEHSVSKWDSNVQIIFIFHIFKSSLNSKFNFHNSYSGVLFIFNINNVCPNFYFTQTLKTITIIKLLQNLY